MKRIGLVVGVIIVFSGIKAQESSDYGVFLGMNQQHVFSILPIPLPGTVVPAVGAFYRYNLNPRYSLRAGGNYALAPAGGLSGLDLHALFEFNFLPLDPRRETPKVSTFVATGVAYYNPDASAFPVRIPFILGAKFRLAENLGVSAEWSLRKKVGSGIPVGSFILPSNWYSFAGITLHYKVEKKCKDCPYYENTKKKKK